MQASKSLCLMSDICNDLTAKIFGIPSKCDKRVHYYHDDLVGVTFDILKDRFGLSQRAITDMLLLYALYNSNIIYMLGEQHVEKVDDMIKRITRMFNRIIIDYLVATEY